MHRLFPPITIACFLFSRFLMAMPFPPPTYSRSMPNCLKPSPLDYHTRFLYSRTVHFSAASDLGYAYRLLSAIHNPFIWNTVIRAYARSPDQKPQSLALYRRMLTGGSIPPDKYTFPFVLKACAFLFAVWEGRHIHAHILKTVLAAISM